MIWPHLKILWHGKDNSAGDTERSKKERKTKEEIERLGFGDSLRAAEDRKRWKGTVATSSVVPRRPPRLRDRNEMRYSSHEQKTYLTLLIKYDLFTHFFIYIFIKRFI